ncbi:DUF4097 domain-containing protein [Cellulomonas sp. RIT-PI-Y]|uniref:DUF4097 domain-containing protein n=1 Tax=Cellulomonas sp. RIT-PI-Y TaxID=3035297 RepID=UPI0021DADF91|nr:DUF4097 domain-containing protein [Cellulomonas sp. RIT-PI-Y]
MATESWVVSGPQVIEVEDVHALRVRVSGGRVDVVAHDDPARTDVRLEVHSVEGHPLEVTYADGALWAGVRDGEGLDGLLGRITGGFRRDRIDLHVAVPRAVVASVSTVEAELLLAGVEQDATVTSVSGAIVTDSTRGALTVRSVSGDVVVREHVGDLGLNDVSGALTASGELTRVHVNTVSGDVAVDTRSSSSMCQVKSVSGDVTVRLPAGHGVNVEATSVSGRVLVDGVQRGDRLPGRTQVDLRDPGATCFVTTRSVSGDLTVVRAPSGDES